MTSREIYECGFDEDDGKTIAATECPDCAGSLETDGGETACADCGLILDEYRLDHAARPFSRPSNEQNRKRTGPRLTQARHDRGLSSEIGFKRDAKGNSLSNRKQRQLGRLRREHNRARWRSKAERNLGQACTEIARLTSALELPRSVREEASKLYREGQQEDLIHGRSIEGIAAGAVYAACRRSKHTRTLTDVAEVARCSDQQVWNGYSTLNRELQMAVRPLFPVEFIPTLASTLDLESEIEFYARTLAEAATEAGITTGCNPAGVAGGCLAVAVDAFEEPITQLAIADAADVSPATIRAKRNAIWDLERTNELDPNTSGSSVVVE
ncbi:transcription initiation factor IIB [Halorientalis pallida]|uniref:Transcription initiation factor IIB n=1 Tax=Halorientalis pallida TaxID=2479928 RepID=A0A498KS11_9EURY|nr:transcription initiation factor IIB family protein [Halorientalis pallida]RXK47031.1 transcription initiation factor IIB family protein [Halorientalis pallida]